MPWIIYMFLSTIAGSQEDLLTDSLRWTKNSFQGNKIKIIYCIIHMGKDCYFCIGRISFALMTSVFVMILHEMTRISFLRDNWNYY